MSEAQKKRTSQDCNTESINLQIKAGGIQYYIVNYQKELAMINDRMRDLAIEFSQLKAQEDAEARLRAEIEAKVRDEEVKPGPVMVQDSNVPPKAKKPKKSKDQNPTNEVNQASTQAGSEAVPTPSQAGPVEQGDKKE